MIMIVILEVADQPVERDVGMLLAVATFADFYFSFRNQVFAVWSLRLRGEYIAFVIGHILVSFESEHHTFDLTVDVRRIQFAIRPFHLIVGPFIPFRYFHFEGITPYIIGYFAQIDGFVGEIDLGF